MRRLTAELKRLLNESETLGVETAEAEYEYKCAEAKEILRLRAEGMSVTLIPTLAKGEENVANLRLNRDVALVRYKGAIERINAIKKEMAVVSDELAREWTAAKYET